MVDTAAILRKPTLVGKSVTLVPLGPEHAEALHAFTAEPDLRRLTGTHRRFTREDIELWCAGRAEQDDRVDLAIVQRATGATIGDTALLEIDLANESAGFRIALTGGSLGRGYGAEATRLVLDHAFGAVGVHRVHLEVFTFNERAIRCYRRCGFVPEGRQREALVWDGARHDVLVMGVLRPDWVARQADGPAAPNRYTAG